MITDRTTARDVTADDIRDLIARNVEEESALEFKESVEPKDLLKAACAIANFGGGFIVIGIHEENSRADKLVGLVNSDRVTESAQQMIRDGISPRPVFEVAKLTVDSADVVVVRVAPQNPPHMVSKDKHTDFYMRYATTSDRMRYEEIEQRFRDKHDSGDVTALVQTPRATIESTLGRIDVTLGAQGAMEASIKNIAASGTPMFALISVSDTSQGSIANEEATRIFREPIYHRDGGWTVTKPQLPVEHLGGIWEQRYGPGAVTSLNPSGDVAFFKAVDDALCHRQHPAAFAIAPSLYPNAVIEYCLSFAYMLTDVAATTRPQTVLVVPAIYAGDTTLTLPLGEGDTIWSDAQRASANTLIGKKQVALPIPITVTPGEPMLSRELAFNIASQVYSFFGYQPRQVPFSYNNEVTFEPDAHAAVLFSIRAYLRGTLMVSVEPPREDFDRSAFMFAVHFVSGRRVFWVSEEFIYDHHWPERQLFELLSSWDVAEKLQNMGPKQRLALTTKGFVEVQ
jgi:hypothetical protein